ncbi:arginine deiminase [Cyclobacterium amurskyense]|uniref:arginine deiminase n=1 Tax=Cyclobacterium amurskyense TaxID=320787 RepID=A0A0H4PGN7_9BACT|nr:arginine deiminase family protein [Cyclobacterium amurskyense]AKP51978.1 Arginine deiminase [Cyclobacterium amurskyense]|tara:strand:- start:69 stop:1286 length:1218 start_codon:yes stop_codon:yes gene_type:complete
MHLTLDTEFATLKQVLVHRPGREIDRLTPYNKHLLLFEDVPYLEEMQREHDIFTQLIREKCGAEVYYFDQLLEDILEDNEVRSNLIREALAVSRLGHLSDELLGVLTQEQCVQALIAGIKVHEVRGRMSAAALSDLLDLAFLIPPCPNLYFQRDTAAILPGGMIFSSMRLDQRQRESNMVRQIFENHPLFKDKIHQIYPRTTHNNTPSIEGGDVIILSNKAVAIGCSERTDEKAVYHVAKNLIADGLIERVYEIHLPKKRNFMHLDTVFTILDKNRVLTYPDALQAVQHISVYTRKEENSEQVNIKRKVLKKNLREVLRMEIPYLEIIGTDKVSQEYALREQWFDGANVFTTGPGQVISYNRNKHTNKALKDYGVEVLEMPSSELSRGLGGPRCMSMPIAREAVV